ncbi:hypothetical protein ROZALSC1DRAFT_27669 [Rozella allomycis CSF55]|uniref:RING-type domain-containing protein n=1 Tax=Rozella allomycis (strain CSF55) TaxID=988480 RepID=A0A075AVZ3_ROZAC|nr:hypothetical protein O9G_002056 [Rozella allomycis CSF55]RKP20881.1 hypothetical protein ROZALSC1DRAFT_27669 [Rozella allomycis CSF55]|eukprot:EPZ34483.1 hypothetical protein O9G_002056 [Rozella allomycis CSF55]
MISNVDFNYEFSSDEYSPNVILPDPRKPKFQTLQNSMSARRTSQDKILSPIVVKQPNPVIIVDSDDDRGSNDKFKHVVIDLISEDEGTKSGEDCKTRKSKKSKPSVRCPICLNEEAEELSTTACGHLGCYSCLVEAGRTTKLCPICRKKLNPRSVHRIYL